MGSVTLCLMRLLLSLLLLCTSQGAAVDLGYQEYQTDTRRGGTCLMLLLLLRRRRRLRSSLGAAVGLVYQEYQPDRVLLAFWFPLDHLF